MCFRPTEVSVSTVPVCPKCNKELRLAPGVVIDACPFCHYAFSDEEKAQASAPKAGSPAAGAPNQPKAPKAPGMPIAPKAPQAPQSPSQNQ